MSLDKLLKQIRSIVREEIEYALDKKITESKKNDDRKVLQHGMSLMKELSTTKKQPQKESKTIRPSKTGLNSIQDILNETRMSMESAMYDDEYPELRFSSDSISTGRSSINMVPEGYSETEITPEVSKALTRDYSALMAKLNEKKGA
jgi:hypothetical protein